MIVVINNHHQKNNDNPDKNRALFFGILFIEDWIFRVVIMDIMQYQERPDCDYLFIEGVRKGTDTYWVSGEK